MSDKLLTIELDSIDGVPKVFYKDEEITNKIRVRFDWKTNTDKGVEPTQIRIEHLELGEKGYLNERAIEHNPNQRDDSVNA